MSAAVDPRLMRLLGGEALADLRQRLRRRYEQGLAEAEPASVRLAGLSETEYSAVAALLGLPARHRTSVQVDIAAVDAALKNAGIAPTLRAALEALDGPIVNHVAERQRAQAVWQSVVTSTAPPLRHFIERPHGLGLLKRLARNDEGAACELCWAAAAVLGRLPAPGIPRAQLAAEVLGDAHALDDGQPAAALVLAVLRQHRARERIQSGGIDDAAAERRREIWAGAGILVNELARPALCLNLSGAGPEGQPAYLSLRWLLRAAPSWAVRDQDVYVCENPNLVAIAADRLGSRCKTLICTEGMPAAAQRTLLAQVAQAGARLHYHGDFDWPGLAIGNYMMRVFGARPWRFGAADYLAALADAPRPGAPLTAQCVGASWDAALTSVMRTHSIGIPEEAVAASLLVDLV